MRKLSFQRIAPYYDSLAKLVFGHSLDNAQKAFFSLLPKGASILIIGGGSGRILADLVTKCQPRQITYIEASSRMLRKAEKRLLRLDHTLTDPIETLFCCGTEKDIPAGQSYDVLMTFFLLDIYSTKEARALALTLSTHLKASGSWLFADFCVQENSWKRYWQRAMLKVMYLFFRLTSNLQNQTLPDYERIFKDLGYFPVQQKYYYRSFIISIIYRKLISGDFPSPRLPSRANPPEKEFFDEKYRVQYLRYDAYHQ